MYKLSKKSMKELIGVHPILAFAVVEAIKITKQDFIVLDGLRTEQEQAKNVARGVSKTKNSYHLYGLAVDLVAYVDGKVSWEERHYVEIIKAMETVSKKYGLPIDSGYRMWGWDMPHFQITKLDGVDARTVYDFRKINA